jgi:hypothetical protein
LNGHKKTHIEIIDMGTVFFHIFCPSLLPRQHIELCFQAGFLTLGSNFDFIFPQSNNSKYAVIVKAIIPNYSGGSVPDFNRIPYYLLNAAPELNI